VDDPAGASSQQREECRCGLLLTVEVPAKFNVGYPTLKILKIQLLVSTEITNVKR